MKFSSTTSKTVLVTKDAGFATVTLNRPTVHNAFSDSVIKELQDVFTNLSADRGKKLYHLQHKEQAKGMGHGLR